MLPLDGRDLNGLIKYKDDQVDPEFLQELLSTTDANKEIVLHFISTVMVSMSLPPTLPIDPVNNSTRPEEQDAIPAVCGNYSAMFSYE